MTAHSGYSNAYTASTETNYFFEVAASTETTSTPQTNGSTQPSEKTPNGSEEMEVDGAADTSEPPLYGALDRFAQFFIKPLFLKDTLERELKAVDSENKKNLQNDQWRLSQLDKSLSSADHPYHKFSTGNLQTLRDEPRKRNVEIHKEFTNFHEKHYSANRMKLVVLGKEPLDTLESWVEELFDGVQNKDLPPNRWDSAQPYADSEVLTQVFAKPVMDSRTLDISFTYRDEDHMYKSQPSRYISHLIGHEGPGSILAYIKAKGWANGLSAGAMPICTGAALFNVSIRLTPDGLKNYEEVIKALFQYISLLKAQEPQQWILDEIKGMAEVDFRFKQKSPASSFTSRLSSVMQKPLPREWLLSGERLIREFDPKAIAEGLTYLRADNYRLTIVSQEFPGDWDKKERWYGTEYKIEKVPEALQDLIRNAIESSPGERPKDLHLPHKNEFIPTRLSVERKEVPEPTKFPKLIRKEQGVRTWWKKDDRFWVPKGSVIICLRNPLANVTPENSVKASLYSYLVKDALDEYSYDAEIAGLDYMLGQHGGGMAIEVSGYNDKMPVLLEKVLTCMKELEVRPDRFLIMKERLIRGYRNWGFQQPYRQIGESTQWLSTDKSWTNEVLLAEIHHLTHEDISSFFPQLFHQTHIEVLAHGNLYKEDALRMTKMVETILKPRPLPQTQWQIKRNLLLPEGGDYTFRRVLGDPANVNNCIEYYLHLGSLSDQPTRAKALFLAQLGDEQGFDQLRTKEQLGYIVFTGAKILMTTIGYRVVIQSERSPEYLEERINAFLVTFRNTIKEMSAKEFEGHRRSLINKRLEKLKNLNQETDRFWSYINNEYYNFFQVDTDVAELKQITKADMEEFFNTYVLPSAPQRAKLSVHLVAQSNPKEVVGSMSSDEQIQKVLDTISKYLTVSGIGVESDQLSNAFEDVDILGGDEKGIVEAITNYLKSLNVPEEQLTSVVEQGKQLLGTVLPSLGIQVNHPIKDSDDLPKAPEVKETVMIENVAEFKASLQASTGPRPVVDLCEYEDLEPKL